MSQPTTELGRRRLQVVYLTEPHVDSRLVLDVIAPFHDVRPFDPRLPLAGQLADAEAVLDSGGSVGTREMLAASPNVRLWQIVGSGFDHFDVAHWAGRGVIVANCPGDASAPALAEMAMMLMLLTARRFVESRQSIVNGLIGRPAGRELAGLRLGMLGFGASAKELAILARSFGMELSAIDVRDLTADAQRFHLSTFGGPNDLDAMISRVDVLSLHLHLSSETRHIINRRRIGLMRSGSILINVARGALVDEAALVDALEAGHLAGAGLDVFANEPVAADSRLLNARGIVATPHIAGNTDGTWRRRAEACLTNLDRIADGLEPLGRVDLGGAR